MANHSQLRLTTPNSKLETLLRWRRWIGYGLMTTIAIGTLTYFGTMFVLWRMKEADAAYHREAVAPAQERARDNFGAGHEVDHALATWLARKNRMVPWMVAQVAGLYLALASPILGSISLSILNSRIRKIWSHPDRPALPNAGHLSRQLALDGQPVVARARPIPFRKRSFVWIASVPLAIAVTILAYTDTMHPLPASLLLVTVLVLMGGVWSISDRIRGGDGHRSIEIDPARGRIVFRHFRFVHHFLHNPIQPERELGIRDILGVENLPDQQGRAITVRTTAGKVAVYDRLRNFDLVAQLLDDYAEANRLDPVGYRAALAREPEIKTPWWGWLLCLSLCAAVIAGLCWLMTVIA